VHGRVIVLPIVTVLVAPADDIDAKALGSLVEADIPIGEGSTSSDRVIPAP